MAMGRPKLPPGEKADVTVTFKARQQQRETYSAAAKKVGLSMSVWAKKVLDREAKRILKK